MRHFEKKFRFRKNTKKNTVPNCRCLAALNINILTLQMQFDLVHVKTNKYEGTETTIPITSINFNVGDSGTQVPTLKRGATSPGVYSSRFEKFKFSEILFVMHSFFDILASCRCAQNLSEISTPGSQMAKNPMICERT